MKRLCFLTEIVRRYSGLRCWPCSRNLGLKHSEIVINTDNSLSLELTPDGLLNKCVKTHKKRHLLFVICHWEFLFKAVNLVCRFHVMADTDMWYVTVISVVSGLSPSSRGRRLHLSSIWTLIIIISTLHFTLQLLESGVRRHNPFQLPGCCKNKNKSS